MNQEIPQTEKKSTLDALPEHLLALRLAAIAVKDALKTTTKEERALLYLYGFPKKYRLFVERNLYVLIGALNQISAFLKDGEQTVKKRHVEP